MAYLFTDKIAGITHKKEESIMAEPTLYFGGPILTMEEGPIPQAVLVDHGVVAAVGERDLLRRRAGSCREVDLEGRALLPAFLDGHSHLTAYANSLCLVALEGAKSPQEVLDLLRSGLQTAPLPDGAWAMGFGYDHNQFPSRQHPTRELLDQVCPHRPLLITHASGHMGVLNSAALAALGIDASTPDPVGGRIGRLEGSREPSGYLEEAAFTQATARVPPISRDQLLSALEKAQNRYLAAGITTIQDGRTGPADWALLQEFAQKGRLRADVVCYPPLQEDGSFPFPIQREYRRRLRIGGGKIFLDGSPQGRTAWLSAPYLHADDGYRGYGLYEDRQVLAFARAAYRDGFQLLAHCNGDAAAQQFIDACTAAQREFPHHHPRPVLVHGQLLRKDQLPAMASLGMIASFFVAHTYYWGDIHLENLGRERASRISPARSAVEAGVVETFHQDTPVLPPDMLTTLWCAVQRVTRKGVLLDGEECLSPLEALKAITIHAAWQYGEEDRKGSIRPGKLADLVILDQNPLAVEPDRLPSLQVLETIKEGETVFSR